MAREEELANAKPCPLQDNSDQSWESGPLS